MESMSGFVKAIQEWDIPLIKSSIEEQAESHQYKEISLRCGMEKWHLAMVQYLIEEKMMEMSELNENIVLLGIQSGNV